MYRIGVARGALLTATSLSGAYVLCFLFDLLDPGMAMRASWESLLPGISRFAPATFLPGLVETFLIGAALAVVGLPLYNLYFALRDKFEEIGAARYNDRLKYF